MIARDGTRTIDEQRRGLAKMRELNSDLSHRNAKVHMQLTKAEVELDQVNEKIRKRIGLALHDGPSQLVSYVLMSLDEIDEIA